MQGKIDGSLRSYVGLLRWLQGVIFLLPIGMRAANAETAFLNPPLATLDQLIPFAFVLVGIFSILPWLIRSRKSAVSAARWAAALAVVSIVVYALCLSRSVVQVDITSADRVVQVSVGAERTAFAREHFEGWTDAQMLKEIGFGEEQIQRLWTSRSILRSRIELLCGYIIFLISLNFCVGAIARTGNLGSTRR